MNVPSFERWLALWSRTGARGEARPVWEDLIAHYRETHRAYHNLDHIGFCLAEFDSVRSLAESPDLVEFAIWFHDAIYDTHAQDNEERSAELAGGVLENAGLARLRNRVQALILATKHVAPAADHDATLLVDIDLGILGQPRSRYETFEHQIRQEYAWVSPTDFSNGRSAILRRFLGRPAIYGTETLRDRWETAARENLRWALDRLRDPSA